ncbi:DUF1223 domain-containing protein [Paracoccus rhizosphaerae]|uniref:DUF1223 domain-containing protein n=1 Tax=Paracoccus rhizosphaerae TaxID=1133347 RepID=A0ABV6CHK6_9RHOB|nr:DUF1223 domain-containing protein [Paracoccus rhizosphaerae]
MAAWPKPGLLRDAAGVLAAAVTSVTLLAAPAAAQDGADQAPLILAPDDAARMAPSTSGLVESGGVNSFAATDAAPPVSAGLPSASLPVVVELFTSQGCSSCPPADAMLTLLATKEDVLPLSFHVDYWDYLGWADSFAKPEFSERQHDYASAVGERAVYTPQMIVDGQDTAVAPGPAQLMGLIDAHRYAPALVSIQREPTDEGETIELMPLSDLGGKVEIVLVRYAPSREVRVKAGENRGRVVTYSNVVLSLEHLALWDGTAPLRLAVRAEHVANARFPEDTRHALLVQQMRGEDDSLGQILTAIRLD